jgi:hypothetical protein
MHPTPHHGASHVRCEGARVMPGVGRLVAGHMVQRLAGRVARGKELRLVRRARFDSLAAGACRGSWASRASRYLGLGSPPNKRMHPTADTNDVMYINGVARRVMRGVRHLPPMIER